MSSERMTNAKLRAAYLAAMMDDPFEAGPGVQALHDEARRARAREAELEKALGLAYEAMNHMGDILNDMDIGEEEDIQKVGPAFEAVRAALGVVPDSVRECDRRHDEGETHDGCPECEDGKSEGEK